jgi:hypothetical protein
MASYEYLKQVADSRRAKLSDVLVQPEIPGKRIISQRYQGSPAEKAAKISGLPYWRRDPAAKAFPTGCDPQKLGDIENTLPSNYNNRHPNDWVRGFGKYGLESGESKPGFDMTQSKFGSQNPGSATAPAGPRNPAETEPGHRITHGPGDGEKSKKNY